MDTSTENPMIFQPAHWELHATPEGQEFPYLLLHACGIGECYECTISIPHEIYTSMIERGVRVHVPGMVDALYTPELLEEQEHDTSPL